MSVSSLEGLLAPTNNANMEETGILGNTNCGAGCYPPLNQACGGLLMSVLFSTKKELTSIKSCAWSVT
jgi:hypothetical protein